MSLWVLDTDMLTLWLRGQETVVARVRHHTLQQLIVVSGRMIFALLRLSSNSRGPW